MVEPKSAVLPRPFRLLGKDPIMRTNRFMAPVLVPALTQEVTQTQTLVAVEAEIVGNPPALRTAWQKVLSMVTSELGRRAGRHPCPYCGYRRMWATRRCGFCWRMVTPLITAEGTSP